MKPLRFAKAMFLSFVLGAVLSVGSDLNIMHQAQAIALAKVQTLGADAMKAISSKVGAWLEQGLDAVLKGIADHLAQSG
jgi:uncharacterized membrane protein